MRCTVGTEVMTMLWTFVALGGVVLLAVVSAGAALAAVAAAAEARGPHLGGPV
ncbi:hypothetical protein [uncultured Curtobacterium sp.]|uniref:hypothetical protein n=1 Tax=uncultured Curtobacterium sp. TaxID=331964 RepID=UPI0025844858|nr:hypothetical protein [uncultured Curtobacterium sp.]